MLGKLLVSGRPTYLEYSRTRAYCTCCRCGWGYVDMFSVVYHSGRRSDVDGILFRRAVKDKYSCLLSVIILLCNSQRHFCFFKGNTPSHIGNDITRS